MDNDFDVAIIGLSCRFPGAASPERFWRNLEAGVESIARLTDGDLDASGVGAAERSRADYVRAAPILEDPDRFDAGFFGYPPGEAATLDPQHRILLELAQLALDDAGCDPRRGASRIGVFAGAALNTYFTDRRLYRQIAGHYIPTLVANDKDFLATRISYKLGLRGPSLTVQSACSTALVAVHLARQSLLNEECDLALAGAVSVRVPHRAGYREDGSGVLSPDGHVRAFDAGANGTVFGSGAGMVALERLSDAQARGHRILAVIKGSAINNDGSLKAGYTAPSVDGQAEVVVEALANAGLTARDLSYIEAHGTGTQVGDRIEVLALTKAFREFTADRGFCALGSVKPNVGHLDAAAGMAGLIKTVLALRHGRIPPTLHFQRPNPEIDFASSPFFVNADATPWPKGAVPRRAGVMATGMGGTNAHLVLEEAPEEAVVVAPAACRPELLIVSAKTPNALEQAVRAVADRLRDDGLSLEDAAFTLQTGRTAFRERRFVVADELPAAVAALANPAAPGTTGAVRAEGTPDVALLLPGVGDHYAGMGRGLYPRFPVFREELDRCAELLQPLMGADIRTVLYPPGWKPSARSGGVDLRRMLDQAPPSKDLAGEALDRTLPGQPALFAVEYAVAKLWLSAGVRPAYLLGHSLGEYVAACLSGVMSLQDALRAVVSRAKLVSELPLGGMIALSLPEPAVRDLIASDPELSISLINGPALCVVAGPMSAIDRLRGELERRKILFRPVRNAHAFHSRMMEPIGDRFAAVMREIPLAPPSIPFASNVTGTWITPAQATDPRYWVDHACRTARFGDALAGWWKLPEMALLEAGPGRTLGVLAAQHPARPSNRKPLHIASLRPEYEGADDAAFLLQAAGKLWTLGLDLDWDKLERRPGRRTVALPGYPFEGQRHWIDLPPETESGARPAIDSWFYTAGWREAPLPESTVPTEAAPILTVTAEPGAGADAVRESYRKLLAAVQRHGGGRDGSPLRLAVITRGAFDRSGSELTDPAQAALAAASLTLPREFRGAATVVIDLEPGAPDLDPARVAAEVAAAQPGSIVAWRGRRRWERVLLPTPLTRSAEWRPRGAYLITGGTGGIGLELARYLARTAAARLVLMSRRPPDGVTAEIERLGGQATVVAGNVADADDVERAVSELRTRHGAVHGVFHLAGVLDDRLMLLKDTTAADRVLMPKIAGADHLWRAVQGDQPDFICFFSSLSSVIPFPGQSDYAAANAYLDALAGRIQAESDTRACSIGWPVWRDVGTLARADAPLSLADRRDAMLARGIDFAEGMEALRRALASGLAHVVVTPKGPDAVAREADHAVETAVTRSVETAAAAPAAPSADGPRDEVEQTVAGVWAEMLGRERIGIHQDFIELGGHSLLAMRIVARLRELYTVNLTLRTFFEGPTVARVAEAIQAEIVAEIENLSEEEAAARHPS